MGSRHRAGLGISEITDSLTILVSEETGNISVAIEGILLKMNDREKLLEYLNMFMK
jgi:diadenylate cyclase